MGSERAPRREADDPFRLLLVGDFGARSVEAPPALRRPRRVDIAELEGVFAQFSAELEVPVPLGMERLSPRSLDDLHPDRLFETLEAFSEARELLSALGARTLSAETLTRTRAYLAGLQSEPAAPATTTSDRNDASTLDRLLGRTPAADAQPQAAASPLQALLEDAVRDHKTDAPGGERDVLKAELVRALGRAMRSILQHPPFRALEATWRGADRVIRTLDTDEALEIYLFDISLEELIATFAETVDPEQSELHQLLVANAPGWTVVSAAFAFGRDDAELQALAALGALSARSGAALLADAAPELLGYPSLDALVAVEGRSERMLSPLFQALRATPLAPHIGLVLPRVLGRARYGKKADSIESFPFEEIGADSLATRERLWTSAAFAAAELLGLAFREHSWGYSESVGLTLADLPSDTYEHDGERSLVPPSEAALTQRAAEAVLAQGVMPFIARRDRASLSLLQLASIAEPRSALLGIDSA